MYAVEEKIADVIHW